MSVSSHLLLLLIPVLSLCGATEYYVTPTEPTNTSCPAQPCLTLSQYINDSDHYFQSNTVFKFLPGTHHMDRPLHISDVHNMSLENLDEYPHLVAQFTCKWNETFHGAPVEGNAEIECAAVQLCNTHSIAFKGISLTTQTPNMSGVTLQYASNIHIHLNVTCSLMPFQQSDIRIGILIFKATTVEIYSSHANNCTSGLVLQNTSNINIAHTTAKHNYNFSETLRLTGGAGISLLSATNATITDTITAHNTHNGMILSDTSRVTLFHATILQNGHNGMDLWDTTGINIISAIIMNNAYHGLFQQSTTRVRIVNTTVKHNYNIGMVLKGSDRISILNTTVVQNDHKGVYSQNSSRISVIHTSIMNNGMHGLHLWNTTRTNIINTTVKQHEHEGMFLVKSTRVVIINSTSMYNAMLLSHVAPGSLAGVSVFSSTKISIVNLTVLQAVHDGIYIEDTNGTSIINTILTLHKGYQMEGELNANRGIVLYRTTRINVVNAIVQCTMECQYYGMTLTESTKVGIINTTVINTWDGMHIVRCNRSTIVNTTIMYSSQFGLVVLGSKRSKFINFIVMHSDRNGMNIIHTSECSFVNTAAINNSADGLYLLYCDRINVVNSTAMYNRNDGVRIVRTDRISITNTTVKHNLNAGISSYNTAENRFINLAVKSNGNEGMVFYHAKSSQVANVFLMHNGWKMEVKTLSGNILSASDPNKLPAVVILYYTSLHVREFYVTWNNVSAVKAYASTITASGDVTISNNRAVAGTAFIFIQNGILKLVNNAHIQIRNNHATNIGGVFYILSDLSYSILPFSKSEVLGKSLCFFNTEGSRYQTRFTFENNSAERGGDILYGGHVSYGLDGDWNCLQSFKYISNISQNGLSLITSNPKRICLCNRSGQPDCLIVADPTPHPIYPGQSTSISAVIVGQEFGTVAGSVYAQFLQNDIKDGSPQLGMGQKVQSATQEKCNHLKYTIFSPRDVSETVLILVANNKAVSNFVISKEYRQNIDQALEDYYHIHNASALNPLKYSDYPVYINFTFLPCPVGFLLTVKPPFKCDCNKVLQELHGVKCHIQGQTIGRSGLVWVGTLRGDNETVAASEYCFFDYCNKEDSNVTLSDPDSQCNYNHSGTLCGGCQPGLSLALGSAQCLPCSNKYLALLIPFVLAGPALVFFIKLLDITISQGTINELVFYANIVIANKHMYLPQGQTNPLTLFIAWLNLDLGVETCFFHGLTAYTKTWLQFVFPLYIWSIAGLIIVLAKYSDKVAKTMGNNSVPVLATLFLLSYAKLFRTIITILSYTMLYSSQGHKTVWSADGNVDYLGPKHAPLFAVAVAALLLLWLPYTLLIFTAPWLYKCNCRQIDYILMKIKPFLDAHYGPLKGKHHYWFGALLFVRAIILLISALIPTERAIIANFCISVSATLLMYFGLIVYSSIVVTIFDFSFLTNLALMGVSNLFVTSSDDQEVAAYTLIGIALAQFVGLVIFRVFSIIKRSKKVMACLDKRQSVKEEEELFEETTFQSATEFNHTEEMQ